MDPLHEEFIEPVGTNHPEILAGEFRELAARVCTLCWDGEIRMPLMIKRVHQVKGVALAPQLDTGFRFVDQGIDLLWDTPIVMNHHRCPQAKNEDEAEGVWEPVNVIVPASFYRDLATSVGFAGGSVGTEELRAEADAATGYGTYTPEIRRYHIEPLEEAAPGPVPAPAPVRTAQQAQPRITRPLGPQQGKSPKTAGRKLERQNRARGQKQARLNRRR